MPERGQMIERGDGKWLLRIYLGRVGQKRQYASEMFEGTTSQARKRLTAMLNERDVGTFVIPSKQTLQDYIEDWLDGKSNASTKTLLDYRHRMEKDVFPFIGTVRLDKLTPAHIRTLYGKLVSDRGLSPRTIRYTHTVLSQALDLATDDGLLQRNPCKRRSVREVLPKQTKTQTDILTPEEVLKVISKEPDVMKAALWRLLLTSALRPQEAIGAQWADLVDGVFSVNRAAHAIGRGRYEITDLLKTDSSRRTIDLSSETIKGLEKWKTEQAVQVLKAGPKYDRQGYIFATRYGTPLDIANIRRWWKAALTRCGLPERRLYTTRHTHLSHLIDAGENPAAVAERSGHADPSTLLSFYTHAMPKSGSRLAETQEGLFQKTAQG